MSIFRRLRGAEPLPSAPAETGARAFAAVADYAARRWERPVPYLAGAYNVCGSATVFFCAEPGAARESLVCAQCKATSRYRGLARGILRVFREAAGVEAESLAQLGTRGADRTMRVYDTQTPFSWAPCAYPIPEVLRSASWIELHVSSYRPDLPWGTELGPGWSNQTLELLTFADGTFDLVLTSDVMEHVRLDARAHAEIARVLRVGGAYVFQVDHTRDRHETELHVRIPDDPSADEFLVEPMYHGDANSEGGAALCYRRYGTDLDDMLGALGFDVEYVREDLPAAGIPHGVLPLPQAALSPAAGLSPASRASRPSTRPSAPGARPRPRRAAPSSRP